MSRLGLVTLIVEDYDVAISWFTAALGWVLREDRDEEHKRWVVVGPAGGGTGIVLARAASATQASAIGQQGAGRVWLFLETDDIESDRARMEAAGTVYEEPTRDEPYGQVAVFCDPWGNRWDLLQRK
ncbi:VOC family protein [Alphaproteobacteria bacterium GH1-50]|uniref:VOC family protein n=1 Tax=Kangsaoukella pontilimi TaxID=2691042 RepID=A0A7C9IRU6_9RHOB|nr:VOC family protein [Kangsaoukella pontilimi]MXQ07926.1 VOC family protein [Kangsaoukella pontilimi]